MRKIRISYKWYAAVAILVCAALFISNILCQSIIYLISGIFYIIAGVIDLNNTREKFYIGTVIFGIAFVFLAYIFFRMYVISL